MPEDPSNSLGQDRRYNTRSSTGVTKPKASVVTTKTPTAAQKKPKTTKSKRGRPPAKTQTAGGTAKENEQETAAGTGKATTTVLKSQEATAPREDVTKARSGPLLFDCAERLRLLICPAFMRDSSAKPKLSKKARDARRKVGIILKDFVDMPPDVILEICSYIEPVDLLNLSRVSKAFRSFFLSPSMVSIWKRVLEQAGAGDKWFPKCPEDMTLPQFASLMFDKFCMACLGIRGIIEPDFMLRVRLCAGCKKQNLLSGYRLKYRFGTCPTAILPLLPSSGPRSYWITPSISVFDSAKNDERMLYFLPEVELMLKAYSELSAAGGEAYDKFLAENLAKATRMVNEGLAMKIWAGMEAGRVESGIREVALERRRRMIEEMKALGWEERFFPNEDEDPDTNLWDSYLNQPKEFSERSWAATKPRLDELYQRKKRRVLCEDVIKRIEAAYFQYRKRQKLATRIGLPPWQELRLMAPSLVASIVVFQHREYTEEDIQLLMERLRHETEGFLPSAQADLVTIMKGTVKASSMAPAQILRKASSLFFCKCDECEDKKRDGKRLYGYPAIMDHWIEANVELFWDLIGRDVSCVEGVVIAAEEVLVALGLAKDCSRDEVVKLGKLACRCGNPKYCGPLSFEKLVYHVYLESKRFSEMWRKVHPNGWLNARQLLVDGHDAEGLKALVGRATAEDEQAKAKIETNPPDKTQSALSCRYCYELTRQPHPVTTGLVEYHMLSLHGLKAREVGDLAPLGELMATFGKP